MLKRSALIVPCFLLCAIPAIAATFRVGDRVRIGGVNQTGTVIAVGAQLRDGGAMIKVSLDSFANRSVGIWYDSVTSRVSVIGHGSRALAPAMAPRPHGAGYTVPSGPANSAAGSAGACQSAIRANYPNASDTKVTVSFKSWEMGGAQPYEAVYANDWNGRGHTVSAQPVHTVFTVYTHYADPNADDELRTYDANYMCYRDPLHGGWVASMQSRKPGGEHATYIKKH